MNFLNNSNGGSVIRIVTSFSSLEHRVQISSSDYINNSNGALKIVMGSLWISEITLHGLVVKGTKGTFIEDITTQHMGINQGAGILIIVWRFLDSKLSISNCNIHDNIGSKSSIFYITVTADHTDQEVVSIISSNFTDNVGPALHLSNCATEFRGHILFMNNSAGRGAAIYLDETSQIAIKENTVVEFNRNIAKQ